MAAPRRWGRAVCSARMLLLSHVQVAPSGLIAMQTGHSPWYTMRHHLHAAPQAIMVLEVPAVVVLRRWQLFHRELQGATRPGTGRAGARAVRTPPAHRLDGAGNNAMRLACR